MKAGRGMCPIPSQLLTTAREIADASAVDGLDEYLR
jgi:hypothetical protein